MTTSKIPTWFYIVSALALLWNLAGVGAYISQMTMTTDALAALPESERAMYTNFPLWANIAFAAAVFGGALGCVGLLMKKRWAKPLFAISLVGIVVQLIYNVFVSGAMEVYGPGAMVMPVMVLIIGVLLLWWAGKLIREGWIG